MGNYNITRTRLGDWDLTWNGIFLGSVDKVTPDLKIRTVPIKVGSMGDAKLGERIIELDGNVKAEAREIDLPFYQDFTAWNSTGTNAATLQLIPSTPNVDMYTYSQLLRMHPTDASDATQDLALLHAVPLITPMNRDGKKDDMCLVTFVFYPDRTSLPNKSYGYYGTGS